MTLTSGQLLAQRYRLSRRIAIGGMGEVWEAADTRLDRMVAVKVLKPELSGDAEFRRRFHTEARMTASLNHPGIAAVHDYGEAAGAADAGEPDVAFLVMELVAGEPLAAVLMRQPRQPVDRTLDILQQAADALQAAHERGVVHRDIKPANILITPAGNVKLTDFGIARAVDAAPVTRHGMVMGTAHYIAPEQADGHEAGTAADVYSLGVVGYECLAGQRPFLADSAVTVAMMHIRDTPPPLPPDVPSGARALIDAALVKDPRRRYGSGGEFAAALAAVRAGHRPPPPAGMAGTGAVSGTAAGPYPGARISNHPSQTALLPPGALSEAAAGPRHGPPTGGLPAERHPPRRRHGWRGTAGVVMVLLAALALVFSGYLVREAVRSNPASPAGPTSVPENNPAATTVPRQRPAPAPPVIPNPLSQLPDLNGQPPPGPTNLDEQPQAVLVNPAEYLRHTGRDAALIAQRHGLQPRVLDDEDGQQLSLEKLPRCRVVDAGQAGFVQRGSTIELTCRRTS
ncbi:MAG TPA: serine/threonine-protein kinase [Pseudonocardiaceae bacterium]